MGYLADLMSEFNTTGVAPSGYVAERRGDGGDGYDTYLTPDASAFTERRFGEGGARAESFNPTSGLWERSVYAGMDPTKIGPESWAQNLGFEYGYLPGYDGGKGNLFSEATSDPNFRNFALSSLGAAYGAGAFEGGVAPAVAETATSAPGFSAGLSSGSGSGLGLKAGSSSLSNLGELTSGGIGAGVSTGGVGLTTGGAITPLTRFGQLATQGIGAGLATGGTGLQTELTGAGLGVGAPASLSNIDALSGVIRGGGASGFLGGISSFRDIPQALMQWAGSTGSMPWGSPGNLLSTGSSIYGLIESQRLKKMAQMAAMKADPWGTSGGRGLADSQLQTLMRDPSGITKMPGYDAGIQAIERRMAAQGYTGSGNMMTALHKYGGDFYNNAIAQLGGMAGAGVNPGNAAALELNGNNSAIDLASRSLASLGYAFGRTRPNQVPGVPQ